MKVKLLDLVVAKGYESDEAMRYIKAGKVMVNNEVVFVPSVFIFPKDNVVIKEKKEWVSRGAHKLLKAIEVFKMDVKDNVALDIGSSTGGFTQVLLVNGAKKVYSIDVGTNQLDFSLRRDERVVVKEKTNLKTLEPSMFSEQPNLAVCDVSFISLKRVFDVLENILQKGNHFMALIKPQFEANSSLVKKGGYVEEKEHKKIIEEIVEYAKTKSFEMLKIDSSPILGNKSKNIEYITLFRKK